MGLWSSIIICLGFSVLLIAVDEVIHARRRKRREAGEERPKGH